MNTFMIVLGVVCVSLMVYHHIIKGRGIDGG
jgi:hypothetical protein